MNIYRIWQDDNNGYDTYDSAVVYANSVYEAKRMLPKENMDTFDVNWYWTTPDNVHVEYLGTSVFLSDVKPGLILASFQGV